MKQELDLTPFQFAYHGALAALMVGLIDPLVIVLCFVLRDPDPFAIIYLLDLTITCVGVIVSVGATTGFIIGLFYAEDGAAKRERPFRPSSALLLRMALAGMWFAISTALVLWAFDLYTTSPSSSFDIEVFSWQVLFPGATAGVFALVLGTGILKGSDPNPALRAMIRGAIITTGCCGVWLSTWALRATLHSVRPGVLQFFWLLMLLMVWGKMLFAFPVAVVIGAVSGLLLHWVSRNWISGRRSLCA
jgi:hypothetical protein